MDTSSDSTQLAEARGLASAGLPITGRAPVALLRRLLVRALWPSLGAQVACNAAMLDVLESLNHRLLHAEHDLADDDGKLERLRRQAFERYHEGIGALRSDLSAVAADVTSLQAELPQCKSSAEELDAIRGRLAEVHAVLTLVKQSLQE